MYDTRASNFPSCSRPFKHLGDLSGVRGVGEEGWVNMINLKQYNMYFKGGRHSVQWKFLKE